MLLTLPAVSIMDGDRFSFHVIASAVRCGRCEAEAETVRERFSKPCGCENGAEDAARHAAPPTEAACRTVLAGAVAGASPRVVTCKEEEDEGGGGDLDDGRDDGAGVGRSGGTTKRGASGLYFR